MCRENQLRFCALLTMWFLLTCLIRAERCPNTGQRPGDWSRLAVVVCEDAKNQMHLKMASPDGQKVLTVLGDDLDGEVFVESVVKADRRSLWAARPGEEVLWSPDSKAIVVTICFGASGPCKVWITSDNESAPDNEDWDMSTVVIDAFSTDHKGDDCYTWANVGALTWEDGSERIVLIAEVPPSPECQGHNEGYFEAFEVSLSQRKVLSRFNMQQTIQRWRDMFGKGLRSDIKLVREDASEAVRNDRLRSNNRQR